MTKDEYGDLLAEIGGGQEIGIAARQERDAAENKVLSEHDTEVWAILCLGDALHQFYRDSLGLVRARIPGTALSDVQIAMIHWHIVSFNRFAAAFDLMVHGYYFEAMVLARDLWEVALSLAGLGKKVITLDELLATKAITRQEAEELSRKSDAKIRAVLIQKNAALSQEARTAVETFKGIANLALHKSKLNLGLNFRTPDIRGKNAGICGFLGCVMRNIRCISFRPDFHSNPPPIDRIGPPGGSECCKNFSPRSGALNLSHILSGQSTPIFPRFDLERASAANNVLYLATWSIVSTLPYLDFALATTDPAWGSRYGKVQLAFREGLARGPNPVVQAWPEIISQVF